MLTNEAIFTLTDKQREIRDVCASDAKNILVYGGSRSGKTFFLCYAILTRAIKAPGSRHVVFRRHGVAVKQSVGRDTLPKVAALAYPDVDLKWHEQDAYFSLPNGSEIWLAGLDDKERVDKVLGREYATLYFNEASEILLQSYDVAQTRLAQRVRQVDGRWLPLKAYVDLNPTTSSHWTYRLWIDMVHPDGELRLDQSDYSYVVANPRDNLENLDPSYIKSLEGLPERQRKRFFYGEFTGDVENALWRRDYFKRTEGLPTFRRIVVAIDPAVSSDIGSDETGIIVAGMDENNIGYILDDASGKYRPEEWARRAISMFDLYQADRIVAEVNQGGEMVHSTLKTISPNVPFKAVTATRGKAIRAEPIAALYEQGKVYHVKDFHELESQMCSFTSDFDRKLQGYSPDRVDALVWALTELFPQIVKKPKTTRPTRRPSRGFF